MMFPAEPRNKLLLGQWIEALPSKRMARKTGQSIVPFGVSVRPRQTPMKTCGPLSPIRALLPSPKVSPRITILVTSRPSFHYVSV